MPVYAPVLHWKKRAIIQSNQAPPVINTWYTALEVINTPTRLYWTKIRQTNGELAAKNVEIRITVDGIVLASSPTSCANNTWMLGCKSSSTDGTSIVPDTTYWT